MSMKRRVLSFLEEGEQKVLSFLEESEQRILLFLEEREKERIKLSRFLRNGSVLQEGLIAASNGKYDIPIRGFTAEELLEATKRFSQRFPGDPNGVMFIGHIGKRPILVRKWPESVMFLPEIYREVICDAVITAMMSHHKNVLRLIGCCLEFEYPALVYEYTGPGILSCILDSTDKNPNFLSWKNRVKIASDISNAIVYLHSAFPTPIIHRDLKPSKVIIDEHGIAKLVDFSLAVVLPPGESRVIDLVYGTPVFLDPEYYESRFVSEKSDVYSFGIFLLILLTGKTAFCEHPGGGNISILEYVRHNKDQFNKLVDPKIEDEAERYVDQTFDFLDLAMSCTNARGQDRPNMIDVAKKLRSIERQVRQEKKRSELFISKVQSKEILQSSFSIMQKMDRGRGSKGRKGMKQLPNSNGRFLREEGEPFRHQNEYRVIKEFFTIRLHGNGEFKKFRGRRAYVGGWVRFVDFCYSDYTSMIMLTKICKEVGVEGLCFYFYMKPMSSLDYGLVHLRIDEDIVEMVKWVPTVRIIDVYVTHPSLGYVKSMLISEMYAEVRRLWPKCVLVEIDDVQASMLTCTKVFLLEWYPTNNGDDVESGVEGQNVVQGGLVENCLNDVDAGMEATFHVRNN